MIKENINLLIEYKYKYGLSKQQVKTFKGQILAGDIEGFRKGLFNLMKIRYLRR